MNINNNKNKLKEIFETIDDLFKNDENVAIDAIMNYIIMKKKNGNNFLFFEKYLADRKLMNFNILYEKIELGEIDTYCSFTDPYKKRGYYSSKTLVFDCISLNCEIFVDIYNFFSIDIYDNHNDNANVNNNKCNDIGLFYREEDYKKNKNIKFDYFLNKYCDTGDNFNELENIIVEELNEQPYCEKINKMLTMKNEKIKKKYKINSEIDLNIFKKFYVNCIIGILVETMKETKKFINQN